MEDGERPTILITNDDGIDAPGLRALVQVLVSANRFNIQVCAPDRERSAVSHSITWLHPIEAKPVNIEGASAYAVSGTPADCASLGISKALFPTVADLVPRMCIIVLVVKSMTLIGWTVFLFCCHRQSLFIGKVLSGINMGSNCGYHVVYSGTVAGAREAFFNDLPSISISYDWVRGKSNVNDFSLAAQACLPIISAVIVEIKNQRYPQRFFLNVDLPANVADHKGYRLTKQGKSFFKMGWKQVASGTEGERMSSTMTMDVDTAVPTETNTSSVSPEHLLFRREAKGPHLDDDDTDHKFLQEGYITVTPLAALSQAEADCDAYLKDWLSSIHELPSPSAL